MVSTILISMMIRVCFSISYNAIAMKKVFLLFSLILVLGFSACKTPTGKAVFWSQYGTNGSAYWYYLEVKNQSSGSIVFENAKVTVTSVATAPGCDSSTGFVLSSLKLGTYLYTVYYGGSTGPNGKSTGSFTITEDGCVANSL
jgi:hypothetical protein